MRKMLSLVLVFMLALSFIACNNKDTPSPANSQPEQSQNSTPTPTPPPPKDNSTTTIPETPATDKDDKDKEDDAPEDIPPEDDNQSSEWKEFLRLYEEWVDEYVELVEKYNKNPMDTTILNDYMTSMQKLSEWAEQAQKTQSTITGNDLTEYLKVMNRIVEKLNSIS